MHEIEQHDSNLITVRVSGKLTQADYDALIPAWDRAIAEKGTLRLLFVMENFHGWEPGAAWEDFRFGVTHAAAIEWVAMVGEKKWQEWLARIGSWFMHERVRYFEIADLAAAERWVRAG